MVASQILGILMNYLTSWKYQNAEGFYRQVINVTDEFISNKKIRGSIRRMNYFYSNVLSYNTESVVKLLLFSFSYYKIRGSFYYQGIMLVLNAYF